MLKTSGTPPHASPQQLRGEPPEPRDDVYALGVMAYQLLVGRGDAKVQGNWHKRLKDDGVPAVLIDLIGDSTSEELTDRPNDAGEWEESLATLVPQEVESRLPTGGSVTVHITVAGSWRLCPMNDSNKAWSQAIFTPGPITFQANQQYEFRAHVAVTDQNLEGMRELADIACFSILDLSRCGDVTGAGLEHLAGLTRLRTLVLSWCQKVTDADLRHLAGLTGLETLSLWSCKQVTDEGLEYLAGLVSLKSLSLSFIGNISDVGLANLRPLATLQHLGLSDSKQVTDDGLSHLASLRALRSLDLRWRKFTDRGLEQLKKLTTLRSLDLSYCHNITDTGIAALKKALPNCKIEH